MRTRGATTPETNWTAATDALIALVRLLARETARESLGQTPARPETTNGLEPTIGRDAGREYLRADEIARLRGESTAVGRRPNAAGGGSGRLAPGAERNSPKSRAPAEASLSEVDPEKR